MSLFSVRRAFVLCLIFCFCPAANPLRAELVGWWTFDGNLEDSSEFQNHGSLLAPVFEDDVPDAIGGGTSLRFEGASGVEIAPDASLDSARFTLSFWLQNRGQIALFSRILSRGADSFEVAVGNGGGGDELRLFAPANGWRSTFQVIPNDVWQHVAVVSDGFDVVAYVEGEVVYGPAPLTAAPTGVLHLGYRHNGIEGLIGSLDDVSLFSEALIHDQVLAIAEEGTETFLESYVPGSLPPVRPRNLRASPGDARVSMAWDPVGGTDTYNVYRAEAPAGEPQRLNAELLTDTAYVDETVENGVEYNYYVTAVNDNGESQGSSEVLVTPMAPLEDPEDFLILWWDLDGDLLDKSGNALDASPVLANPSFSADVPDAINGGESVVLDGSSGFEILGGDPRLDSTVFTLSMFVRNAGQTALFQRLTSRAGDTFETAVGFGAGGVDRLKFFSHASDWVETIAAPPLNSWVHVAFVATGTQMTVYMNGQVQHGPFPFAPLPSGLFRVGLRHDNSEGFRGGIDDVAFFDAVLSADDIATIADSGVAGLVGEVDPGDRPPAQPDGLRATAMDGSIVLDWNETARADRYAVYRSEAPGEPYEQISEDANLTETTFVDAAVQSGVRYYYVVSASNEAGESRRSSEVSALVKGSTERFVRGDVDGSGSINLSDGIQLLLFQFQGGEPPACGDAADTDDSGRYNLTDAIIVFQWLFLGGQPPRAPSPDAAGYSLDSCAEDPSSDDPFDCLTSVCAG